MAANKIPKLGSLVAVVWLDSGASSEREELTVENHTLITVACVGRLDFVNRRRILISWEWDYSKPFDQANDDANRSSVAIARKNIVKIIKLLDHAPQK